MYKKQARKSAFDNRCVSVHECRKNHYQTAWQNDFYKLVLKDLKKLLVI